MKKSILIIISILLFISSAVFTYYGCKLYYKDKVIFKLNGEEVVNIEYGNEYEELLASAKIFNKELTSITVVSNVNTEVLGNYEVKYVLESKLFEDKELIRQVNVIDTVKPVITVEKTEVSLTEGSKFVAPSYSATDNYDGDISNKVTVTDNVNVNKAGTYNATYTAEDSSGNTSTVEVKVTVKAKKVNGIIADITINERESVVNSAYIKVSISEQKLYYYENDKLIIKTDVITGKPSTPTPTGTFKVTGKARNTILRGSDYASFVSYWIAFIKSTHGIHDASWKTKFGGELYKTEGSHGCVNTPTEAVSKLYEYVKVGTPVYIYE